MGKRFVQSRSAFGIVLMTEDDFSAVYVKGMFVTDDLIDMERAYAAGVRMFVFVDGDKQDIDTADGIKSLSWLDRNPGARPFVTGTWDELEAIKRDGRIKVRELGHQRIMNPLQGTLEFSAEVHHELNLCATTADSFLLYFGKRAHTFRFAHPPKEAESGRQIVEIS